MLWKPKIRLRFLFMLTFVLAALLPAAFLAVWVFNRTTEHEFANTAAKQIALARTFAMSLDRYAADRLLIFEQCAESYLQGAITNSEQALARKSDFVLFAALHTDSAGWTSVSSGNETALTQQMISAIARDARSQTAFLPVMLDGQGKPILLMAKRFPNGDILAGGLSAHAISSMQKTVSFGVHGHAVIVDQFGHALGHPKAAWEAMLKSLAGIEPVQQVIQGKTGSATFYAPARHEDALAGFTQTRHAGWGVLMVRPLAEINDLAWANTRAAFFFIGAGVLIACAVACFMARVIVRPVERAAETARSLSQGKLSARVDPIPDMPLELAELGNTLNQLAERIDGWRTAAAETLSTVKAADQAKQDFLATLSHEVRTPLNAIIGFGELTQMQTGQPEELERHREYAANIVTAGRHLLRLIDEILDLASIEAGQKPLEAQAVNLAHLVNEASTLLQPAATKHQMTLAVNIPPQMPAVVGKSRSRSTC